MTLAQLCERRSSPLRFFASFGKSLALSFAIGCSLLSINAHAQFNGPPSAAGLEINRPFTLTSDPEILHPPVHDSTLQPGDLVAVRLYGDTDYTPSARLSSTGDVFLPLAGSLHFAGLTVAQASELLAEKLTAGGMYRDPAISILATDGPNQTITVVGEAHGIVPAVGTHHLLETLAAIGGIPATASHIITINRRGLAEPIIVDIGNDPLNTRENDIPVFAGDTIIISRIGIVYVIGAFKTTGVIPLNSYGPLTLTELSALSGGTLITAKYDDLRIIRTIGTHRTVSVVDIKKIQNGKAPDPILEPNDIVYLAPSAFKTFFLGGTLGTVLGFASLAISLEAIR
jgi:polysaccharide export outer membrane protein